MAINFTDSPSNGATQTIGGRTYTYNSAKNKWDTTATEVTGPTATVYASVDNLPTSGNITGSQAFVSGTNRLYIWNGSGWYNIALINSTPTISGVSSSYSLASDGTATTVTITATDPEGLPITYSIASDTSGNTATVTQGTGSNTNVFTITPSTNTAHAGTFSLTFRASDGVNLATAVSSFTLQFAVQNQKYTSALITSVGANNAVNNSFDDKSTSNHTLPVSGDVHQTTFSPYRHGGYSTYFDGSGDYLTSNSNGIANFGTGAFTIEGWLYLVAYPSQWNFVLDTRSSGSDSNGFCIEVTPSDFGVYAGENMCRSGSGFGLKEWKHWAYTRDSSGNHKVFINGTQVGSTFTGSKNYTTDNFRVSAGHNGGDNQNAYQRDLRVIKGTALYTANFTPPTEPLTAVTNTSFLGCHLPYIADGSTNAHTITISGDPETRPFSPYDAQEYAAADHGGSISLDGNGDRIRTAASADFGFGTGDFTIEWWTYFNPGTIASVPYPYQIDMRSADNDTPLSFYLRSNLQNQMGVYVSAATIATGTYSFKEGVWQHYAVCKTGGYLKGYYNGKQDFSITCIRDYGSSETISIGGVYGNNNYWVNGNMADVRVVKGTAVYTSDFTPPTAPLTAITNTKLLIQGTDAGIIDKAQSEKSIKLVGDTKSSTTQAKYLSSSISFDGNGDYMILAPGEDWAFGTGDFTVEYWVYYNSIGAYDYLYDGRNSGQTGGSWSIAHGYSTSDTTILQWGAGTTSPLVATSNPSTGQWVHVAWCRSGSTFKLFYDGVENQSVTDSTNYSTALTSAYFGCRHSVQMYLDAYISDFRVTKGLARYTANFTPPAAALKG